MTASNRLDAIVVGSGPNGLAAALTLARAGRSVRVYEAESTIGGGTRTEELTLPGFRHDVCSTIVSMLGTSPFMRTVDWAARGVEVIHPDAPLAHPFDGGRATVLERSLERTEAELGRDGAAWRRLFEPLVRDVDAIASEVLGPIVHVPRHPLAMARFGPPALASARGLARLAFRESDARALFAGLAAHAMLPLDRPLTAGFGLVLGTFAHARGWPMIRGGSSAIAAALAAELRELGGEIVVDRPIRAMRDMEPARAVLFDTTPQALAAIAGPALPARTARRYAGFRFGPGVFKLDWALDGPIPWAAEGVGRAATVHLGGRLEEIRRSERDVATGRHPDRPFTLLVQYDPWDPSRAPAGQTTAWAYCHVPNGSDIDMTERIEAQVERFAPGFRDRIMGRSTMGPAAMERHDRNYVGGDINAGVSDVRQLLFRPSARLDPYRAGEGLYLASSSAPPGGGVHGMAGHLAARSALRHELR